MPVLNTNKRKMDIASLLAEQKILIEEHRNQKALIVPDMEPKRFAEIKARMELLSDQHLAISKKIQMLIFSTTHD